MKKNLFLIFLLVCSFNVTGCHGSKSNGAFKLPEEFDTTKEYNLSFWSKNDSNVIQKNIYLKAIEEFEELYPNIHIELKSKTNYDDIYRDVINNISTNTTPNVCITYPDHVATYLAGDNIVVSLDNLMTDEKYGLGGSELRFDAATRSEYIEKFIEECKYQDHYYCMPYMRSTEALYINKTRVNELGYEIPDVLTWDFVWEVCDAAVKAKKENDILYPFIYKSVDNQMISMLKQKHADYTTSQGDILLFNDDTKAILKDLGAHKDKDEFEIFAVVSYPANYLNAGQAIFAIDSTAGATWMGSDAPLTEIDESEIINFETVVRPIPQYDVEDPQMISQGPSVCIFNKEDDQEVLASWIFVQYLLSNNVQIPYSETEGYIPVTYKAIESEDYKEYVNHKGDTSFDNFDTSLISAASYYTSTAKKNNPAAFFYKTKIEAAQLCIDNIENTFVTPVFNGSASVRSAAGKLIELSIKEVNKARANGDYVSGAVDDEFVDSLFESVKNSYKLGEIQKTSASTTDFGKLSGTAIALILCLAVAWIGIISYYFINKKKEKARNNCCK